MSLLRVLRHMVQGPRRWPSLRFEGAQEQRFVDGAKAARTRHFMASGLVALVIFNLFLVSDWMMVPDRFEMALQLRLLLFTPVALLMLFMFWRRMPYVLSLPAGFVEGIVVSSGVAAAACLTAVLVVTDSPYAGMYRCGLLPIVVYGTLVQRFRFRFALVFAASVVACHLASRWLAMGKPTPYPELETPMLLVLLVVTAYTLIMNYRMEQEERHRFQQKERAEALRRALEASQAQLEALSRQDALTGVPNRRCFDEVAQVQWAQHQQTGDSLAVLLIDVDHFKAYNDHHGHPVGDQCLRWVAQTLQAALLAATAGSQATLARWGGEEFIVLLPHADAAQAERLAEHLCQAVRALVLRHAALGPAGIVTISVGMAWTRPARDAQPLSVVVSEADAALYRAKRAGRNRVCSASTAVAGG